MGFGICATCNGYWCSVGGFVNYCTCKSIESAPQPAPSGDEATVRELIEAVRVELGPRGRQLVRDAYASGKADGAREEQLECELTVRDSCICQGAECSCSARLRDIERAIARRGSEGT